MADYKCDICGKKATVHITKIINGQKFKIHLCEKCAKVNSEELEALVNTQIALMQSQLNPPNISEEAFESSLKSGENSAAEKLVKCPNCGADFSFFEKNARVSCAYCYETFKDKFDEIALQMHCNKEHKGKCPKKINKSVPKAVIKSLTADLEKAVAEERYEDAAVLRDKIKELKQAK